MKKITFMIFAFLSATIGFAQGLETFDNLELTGTTYVDGSFVGNNDITWTYVHVRNEDTFPIDGNGIMLRRSNEPSSLSATFDGGIGNFSVDTRKAFSGNTQRKLELVINDEVVDSFEPAFADGEDTTGTVLTFEVDNINIEGEITLELRMYGSNGNQQIVLDNIEWTGYTATDPCADFTAPDGDAEQTLDEGQTLADLIVTGEEGATFTWYSDASLDAEFEIPADTEAVNETTYYVTQTLEDCTSEALAITVTVILSTENFDKDAFSFYPNPVSDIFNVSYNEEISTIAIVNMLGQTVMVETVNATSAQMDLSTLATGNYVAQISINGSVQTVKIIKK